MNFRVYVEKKPGFATEQEALLADLRDNLHLKLSTLRLINIYDVFNVTEAELGLIKQNVLSESPTDFVYDEMSLTVKFLATEYLPGQYDLREDSAEQCIALLIDKDDIIVKTGTLILFYDDIDLEPVKKYLINPIEKREKNLKVLSLPEKGAERPLKELNHFTAMTLSEVQEFTVTRRLSMSVKDLVFVQNYFREVEKRNPTEAELAVLDTYWSDHCRHTTFESIIEEVTFPDHPTGQLMKAVYRDYLKAKEEVSPKKPVTLMDLATIYGKYLRKKGLLEDLEVSEENNASSLYVDVKIGDHTEKWLLMFKNETHNHPTEIEPFGGASTCLGGAIRDPLSGRAYVYQAMRITGAGNVLEPVEHTIPGKLPQKVISKEAARGYSSYGNQIGLATTYVREIYHEGYKAKRLEVGAVVGAVKAEQVRRERPLPYDVVLLVGGRTGRDGIGGASGSSLKHDDRALENAAQEVQKGNAPTERKLQRFYRNPEVAKLIKKSNDFGAGGVAVAIGELAPGIEIDLDKVTLKYDGLNALEVAISESQERMAIVTSPEDAEKLIEYAREENLKATPVARVTAEERLVMTYKGEKVVDLSRAFLDTNGVRNKVRAVIRTQDMFKRRETTAGVTRKEKFLNNLSGLNTASQKGLSELFDCSIGASTVLLPYGGKYQMSEAQASVQKLPVQDYDTSTCSILTYGFNPELSSASPFHGAVYAVIEAVSKAVAAGGNYEKLRFSFQEYFKKLGEQPEHWGEVLSALLGAFYIQKALMLPSVGGKDSMSGTFNELHVPPTLIAFAVETAETDDIISPEFKAPGHYIYLYTYEEDENGLPDIEKLKTNFSSVHNLIQEGKVVSAFACGFGGIAEALAKMAFGNRIGVTVTADVNLFQVKYGEIVVESTVPLTDALLLGKTTDKELIEMSDATITLDEAVAAYEGVFAKLYPVKAKTADELKTWPTLKTATRKTANLLISPKVFIPVFPGTNCEYDSERAFKRAGANTEFFVFKNQNRKDIQDSVTAMANHIEHSQILMFSGGFSSGDEPDGSGKFITAVLKNETIREAVERFLERDGLILGICNGFQALIKSGLLPYGKIGTVSSSSPTLARNAINRHVAKMVRTKITSTLSPWLTGMKENEIYHIPVSHGEGRFVSNDEVLKQLFLNGQVATQYADLSGLATMDPLFNPNGSAGAVEGITSPDGRIFGKMGHSERVAGGLYKNYDTGKIQDIFSNGVSYFSGGKND